MRLPTFLVVGAPKAGTTSMNRYLSAHPEVFMPARKGLHYFTHDYLARNTNGPGDQQAAAGICMSLDEYRAHYEAVPPAAKAIGDASPSYLFFSECIPRIRELLGEDVKIVIMARNPIDRAFSNYLHMVRANRETLSFFDALQAEEGRVEAGWGDFWLYKGHSLYYEKVKRYHEAFGSSNVQVILYDDFAQSTPAVMREVYRFLGVDAGFTPDNIDIAYGRTGAYENWFARFLDRPHRIKSMARTLLPNSALKALRTIKDSYVAHNTVQRARPDDRSETFLKQYFADDINRLESLLQVDLAIWKQE